MPYDPAGVYISYGEQNRRIREGTIAGIRVMREMRYDTPEASIIRYNEQGLIIGTGNPGYLTGHRKKVLVQRGGGLGDVLLATPAMRGIHNKYGAHIVLQTSPHYVPMFDGIPHITAVSDFGKRGIPWKDFDAVVDLNGYAERHEIQRGWHRATGFMNGCGVTEEDCGGNHLDYVLKDEELVWASSTYCATDNVVIFVWQASTGMDGNRTWRYDTNALAIRTLVNSGYRVVILCAERDDYIPTGEGIDNLGGQTTIRQCAALMSKAKCVISPDTGLYHIAAAIQANTLGYFGPFPEYERTTHKQGKFILLNSDAANAQGCYPCHSYGCPFMERDGPPCLRTNISTLPDRIRELTESR